MEVTIKKATKENVFVANDFLTQLIRDEKQYDKNINQDCKVLNCYENFIDNDNNCILFAFVDDEIVGYLYGYVIDGGDAYLEKVSQLEAMYVKDIYRGNKIGSMLMKEFKNWSNKKNVRYIELKVCTSNKNAICLYQREGFSTIKYIMTLDMEDFYEEI